MLCLVLGCFRHINVSLLSHICIVLSGCVPCVSLYFISKGIQLRIWFLHRIAGERDIAWDID